MVKALQSKKTWMTSNMSRAPNPPPVYVAVKWLNIGLKMLCCTIMHKPHVLQNCVTVHPTQVILPFSPTITPIVAYYNSFEFVITLKKQTILHVSGIAQYHNEVEICVRLREAGLRMAALVAFSVFLLLLRISVMGSQLPVFTKFDNPAAAAQTPIRQLTMHYLVALNSWLLLFPCDLCCDWTMSTVALVTSAFDVRNVATLTFYSVFCKLLWKSLWEYEVRSKTVLMSAALLAFPFLPASNLFFPVGFVVAERVLYTPSMGFCLLVSYGWSLLHNRIKFKSLSWCFILFVVFIFAAKTIRRNLDWQNEYTIFMAGLRVNQRNAKLYNNVGHSLESQGRYLEALKYFQDAIKVQPDDIGAYINVGRTYHHLHMYNEAEKAFLQKRALLLSLPLCSIHRFVVITDHRANLNRCPDLRAEN
ncbi:protein O-mannosyl-transferase TMTC3 [Caerostris extrusa]|uniref:dolichyl-phosphate-mannose--protein mannosyltransferase n=1 Tax=Caerostris extrusa TaxID=172846 RepID=A0AAV4MA29_CAEEX|nr:protein O-mannosyl-transferase TMTC3 [Caerostris extrusa]